MSSSSCEQAILLLVEWHIRFAHDYPFGISLKAFYDVFLTPLGPAKAQSYSDVFAWWRHATMHAASAGAHAHSGLQVSTTQLLPPELHGGDNGWAQEQAKKIFAPLHAMTLLLSSVAFQTGMDQLRSDLAAQHATREAQELAQHANWEAREDHHDAMQTFKGWFGMAKLEEKLQLLDLMSQDDLPELLHALGCNKKKLDDALVLQMAIDNRAASLVSMAGKYTKPVLSTQIINAFHTYAWAATGELVTDGITPFNITYIIESSTCTIAQKVSHLVTVESRGLPCHSPMPRSFNRMMSSSQLPWQLVAIGWPHTACSSI